MPGFDGTGPAGTGPFGRGLGPCGGGMAGRGRGFGFRRVMGAGWDYMAAPLSSISEKEMLESRKAWLQEQLVQVDQRLENQKATDEK